MEAIDIGGTWVDDIVSGGGAPRQLPGSAIVTAGGHYVWETSSGLLNNPGDDVRYLATDGVTLYDSYSYGNTGNNRSWYRSPDGGDWAPTWTNSTTKGTSNP